MSNRWLRGNLLLSIGAIWAFSLPLLSSGQFLLAMGTAVVIASICFLIIRRGLRIPTDNPAQFGSIPLTIMLFGGVLLVTYPIFGVAATYLILEGTHRLPAVANHPQDFSGVMAYLQVWQGKVILGGEFLSAIVMVIGLAYVLPERVHLYQETHTEYPLSEYAAYCRQQGIAALSAGVMGLVLGSILMVLGSTAIIGIFLFFGGVGALLAGSDWTDAWSSRQHTLPQVRQLEPVRHATTTFETSVRATTLQVLVATVLAVIIVAGTLVGASTIFPVPAGVSSHNLPTSAPSTTLTLVPMPFTEPGTRITEFLFPVTPSPAARYEPIGITDGPDGNLWFADANRGTIGRITPAGRVTEFPLPDPHSQPYMITTGRDGSLWFTEITGNKIGRITTTGTIQEFPLPIMLSLPDGITVGPDGALWFTESHTNKIGRITPAGTITEFPIPTTNSLPEAIAAGTGSMLWFTEHAANQIGRISLSGTITEFPIPTANSQPVGITAGPDSVMWFTEFSSGMIGTITPAGRVTEFALPHPGSHANMITSGPDGTLSFTEYQEDSNGNVSDSRIGRSTTTGTIIEFPLPRPASAPDVIIVGPDGTLWFTARGEIGYLKA